MLLRGRRRKEEEGGERKRMRRERLYICMLSDLLSVCDTSDSVLWFCVYTSVGSKVSR